MPNNIPNTLYLPHSNLPIPTTSQNPQHPPLGQAASSTGQTTTPRAGGLPSFDSAFGNTPGMGNMGHNMPQQYQYSPGSVFRESLDQPLAQQNPSMAAIPLAGDPLLIDPSSLPSQTRKQQRQHKQPSLRTNSPFVHWGQGMESSVPSAAQHYQYPPDTILQQTEQGYSQPSLEYPALASDPLALPPEPPIFPEDSQASLFPSQNRPQPQSSYLSPIANWGDGSAMPSQYPPLAQQNPSMHLSQNPEMGMTSYTPQQPQHSLHNVFEDSSRAHLHTDPPLIDPSPLSSQTRRQQHGSTSPLSDADIIKTVQNMSPGQIAQIARSYGLSFPTQSNPLMHSSPLPQTRAPLSREELMHKLKNTDILSLAIPNDPKKAKLDNFIQQPENKGLNHKEIAKNASKTLKRLYPGSQYKVTSQDVREAIAELDAAGHVDEDDYRLNETPKKAIEDLCQALGNQHLTDTGIKKKVEDELGDPTISKTEIQRIRRNLNLETASSTYPSGMGNQDALQQYPSLDPAASSTASALSPQAEGVRQKKRTRSQTEMGQGQMSQPSDSFSSVMADSTIIEKQRKGKPIIMGDLINVIIKRVIEKNHPSSGASSSSHS